MSRSYDCHSVEKGPLPVFDETDFTEVMYKHHIITYAVSEDGDVFGTINGIEFQKWWDARAGEDEFQISCKDSSLLPIVEEWNKVYFPSWSVE